MWDGISQRRESALDTGVFREVTPWGKEVPAGGEKLTGELEGGLAIESPGSHVGNNGGFNAIVGSFYIRRNSQVSNVVGRWGRASTAKGRKLTSSTMPPPVASSARMSVSPV